MVYVLSHKHIPMINVFVCFQKWMYNPFSPFAPTVEQAGPKPFLNKHPLDLLLEGNVEDVPLITSVTTEDGLVPAGGLCGCCFNMKYILRCFDTKLHANPLNNCFHKLYRREENDFVIFKLRLQCFVTTVLLVVGYQHFERNS
jgi:hypothetical protein